MLTGAQWQPLYYCVRCSGVSPSSAIEHFIFCLFTCFCWQWTGQKQWFCMSFFFALTLQRLVAFGNSHVLSISIEPKNKNKMHQPIGTAIEILSASTSSLQNRRSPHYVRRTLGLHFPLDSVFFFISIHCSLRSSIILPICKIHFCRRGNSVSLCLSLSLFLSIYPFGVLQWWDGIMAWAACVLRLLACCTNCALDLTAILFEAQGQRCRFCRPSMPNRQYN